MTSLDPTNIDQPICPRPPIFKPRTLEKNQFEFNILGANASLQAKGKPKAADKQTQSRQVVSTKLNKTPMMAFLSKKMSKIKVQKGQICK